MKHLKPISIIMWAKGVADRRDEASGVCIFYVLAEKPVEVAKAFDDYDFERDDYDAAIGEFIVTGCEGLEGYGYRPARYHGVTLVYESGKKREIKGNSNPF